MCIVEMQKNLIKFQSIEQTFLIDNTKTRLSCAYLARIGCDSITESILAARHLYEFMAFFVYEQLALDAFEALFAQAPNAIVTKVAKCFLTYKIGAKRESRIVLETTDEKRENDENQKNIDSS